MLDDDDLAIARMAKKMKPMKAYSEEQISDTVSDFILHMLEFSCKGNSLKNYISHIQIIKTHLFEPYPEIKKRYQTSLTGHCLLSIPEDDFFVGMVFDIYLDSERLHPDIVNDKSNVASMRDYNFKVSRVEAYEGTECAIIPHITSTNIIKLRKDAATAIGPILELFLNQHVPHP